MNKIELSDLIDCIVPFNTYIDTDTDLDDQGIEYRYNFANIEKLYLQVPEKKLNHLIVDLLDDDYEKICMDWEFEPTEIEITHKSLTSVVKVSISDKTKFTTIYELEKFIVFELEFEVHPLKIEKLGRASNEKI